MGRARSPCVSLTVLMSVLSKSLDPPRMNVILRTYDDFQVSDFRFDFKTMSDLFGYGIFSGFLFVVETEAEERAAS